MHFQLIKMALLTFITFTLFRVVCSDETCQLAKVASVCCLCGSSVGYSHHRVALFGKKASQERLASRKSALLVITLNDDDGLPNLICVKCKWRVESLENDTEFAEGHEKLLAENPNLCYTPLYYPDKFTISSPNSDVT